MEKTVLIAAAFGAFPAITVAIYLAVSRFVARVAVLERSLQARSPQSLLLRIESQEQRLDELASAIGEVANRVKMQKVRNAANHVTENPKSKLEKLKENPEAWRAEMNRRLANGGVKPAEE